MVHGILYLVPGARTYISSYIDDKYLIGHVNFPQMHVIKHCLRTFCPHFIVSAMTEQTDGDYDVTFKSQAFLSGKIFVFELRAAAEGYDFVFIYHSNENCYS